MENKKNIIEWAMHNYRITCLITLLLFIFGLYSIDKMPKQEFPEFTIRQGIVVGVYPGATSEEVEEQLAKPLERYLFTFEEVKRSKTTSTSQNGMCYVMVELNDNVDNKDEVWSKIKHGLVAFKQQLPAGVLAVVANDEFGDTSALLVTVESEMRSYRELKTYADELGDRLRRIESVSNVRLYGDVRDQISVYLDRERFIRYGLDDKVVLGILASQGITTSCGTVNNNAVGCVPIHLNSGYKSEYELANQIIYNDLDGHVVRLKDVARIVREYDMSESYIQNNGRNCILLSMEMKNGYNIVQYGKEVEKVLDEYKQSQLPDDVFVNRIADQAKVVDDSVSSFMRDLIVSMLIIIAVMMILFPFRSAIVASITIPLSTFISVGIMYLCGIPLNTVTLAALIVVLGMIVDNTIVVIDGYLEYLNLGYSRWYAAVKSATHYFMPMLLATICICMIFFPLLFTLTGQTGDFVTYFPWTITINLLVSLLLAVLIMPLFEFVLIKRQPVKEKQRKHITDYVQEYYEKILQWTFRHGWLTIGIGIASVVVSILIIPQLNFRLMPYADRDQFAVEIYLPHGKQLADTECVVDSLYSVLHADKRVKSVTSFLGCSSPRFQMSYAPQMASRNYAQFIVNTNSVEDTEDLLDEYSRLYSDAFPQAYVKFKQLDYQVVPSLEFRFYGDDLDSLHRAANILMDKMKKMPGLSWIHTDYGTPSFVMDVDLDEIAASQLGVTHSNAQISLALATEGMTIGEIWEGDYAMPVKLKNADRDSLSLEDVRNIYVPSFLSAYRIPLRQIATVEPVWSEEKIVHRNGVRCISVTAELDRDANALATISSIDNLIKDELMALMPEGVRYELGGEYEYDMETFPPIMAGIGISMVIIFFFILINFKKFGITIVSMLSMSLCLFGAMLGLWISGKTISITSVFGFITLLGMIVRNVILMYQHAEGLRCENHLTAYEAAYDAGKRRMVPIFLTTATTAVGVIPMITGGSTFWMPVGITILAGGIGSLILLVTILPVLYWKLYKK